MADEDLEGADIWGDSSNQNASTNPAADGNSPDEDETMLDDETQHMSTSELRQRIHLLDNDIRIMRSDVQRIAHESRGQNERIRENMEKVKLNKQLPYLVGNVVEVARRVGILTECQGLICNQVAVGYCCWIVVV